MNPRTELTESQKRVLRVALLIHVIVAVLTLRDLIRRPDTAVRGRKRLWQIAALLNTSVSVGYWLFGRKNTRQAIELG